MVRRIINRVRVALFGRTLREEYDLAVRRYYSKA